jgi:hypothetical protein
MGNFRRPGDIKKSGKRTVGNPEDGRSFVKSKLEHILGVSIRTIRNNTEALLIASKEIGLEVNVEKTKYMVMSRDQNAGQNGYIQIGNKSFETV